MLVSKAASTRMNKRTMRKMLFMDAKKAHLNPLCHEDVYIMLPEEVGAGPGRCGKLVHWLYGCRPAAQAWESFYAEKIEEVGFERGKGSAVVFYHKEKDISALVHEDDFVFVGDDEELTWIQELVKSWFEVKVRGRLSGEKGDVREMTILGREIRWTEEGLEYEADRRHRTKVLEHFGFGKDTAGVVTNGGRGTKAEEEEEEAEGEELTKEEKKAFRGMAALLNFYSQDCPDTQFLAKEVSRDMAKPRMKSWAKVKRVAKYLVGRDSVVWKFRWQEEEQTMSVWTDSDWGGRFGGRRKGWSTRRIGGIGKRC